MTKVQLIILLLFSPILHSQVVSIPDSNFKDALLNHSPIIDLNDDGEIQVNEAESLTGLLNLYSKNIDDLTGIEAFTNITKLDCSSNDLTNLSLEFNTNLTHLDCEWNNINDLNINFNTNLETLNCSHNQLPYLNLTYNIELREIRARNNLLTNEWVGNCPLLNYLDISYNHLHEIELYFNPLLTEFYCFANQLTTIDTSNNTALSIFDCTENSLTSLDVSSNTQLTNLNFSANELANIDVSNNDSLILFGCSQNNLTSLDLSNNPNLISLWCHYNDLTELDLSNNPNLTYFWCNNNYNLNYINLKNGNNTNLNTDSKVNSLPNLEKVCVDDVDYGVLTDFILNHVNHEVTFTEDCSLSIEENRLNDLVKTYPNPTQGMLNFSLENKVAVNVEIFNILGQLMISEYIFSKNSSIDISTFPTGLYSVKISDLSGSVTNLKVLKK